MLTFICCSVDPNLKPLVYGTGIAAGDDEDWEFVWSKYHITIDPTERGLYLGALCGSQKHETLSR